MNVSTLAVILVTGVMLTKALTDHDKLFTPNQGNHETRIKIHPYAALVVERERKRWTENNILRENTVMHGK